VKKSKVDVSEDTLSVVSDLLTKPGFFTSEREQESSLPSSFEDIAISYYERLYGLQRTVSSSLDPSSELEWTLKSIFVFSAHVSHIKTVAASL
jgi:hypothetical protein